MLFTCALCSFVSFSLFCCTVQDLKMGRWIGLGGENGYTIYVLVFHCLPTKLAALTTQVDSYLLGIDNLVTRRSLNFIKPSIDFCFFI